MLGSVTMCLAIANAAERPGLSWISLWRIQLFRPLVSSPTFSCVSKTMMRCDVSKCLCANSRAIAHPTTPAPTMQTSHDLILSSPPHRARGCEPVVLGAHSHAQEWQQPSVAPVRTACLGNARPRDSHA